MGGWDGMGSRRLDTVESYESAVTLHCELDCQCLAACEYCAQCDRPSAKAKQSLCTRERG